MTGDSVIGDGDPPTNIKQKSFVNMQLAVAKEFTLQDLLCSHFRFGRRTPKPDERVPSKRAYHSSQHIEVDLSKTKSIIKGFEVYDEREESIEEGGKKAY